MSISKQFQHFHQEDLARKVDEIINAVNNNTSDKVSKSATAEQVVAGPLKSAYSVAGSFVLSSDDGNSPAEELDSKFVIKNLGTISPTVLVSSKIHSSGIYTYSLSFDNIQRILLINCNGLYISGLVIALEDGVFSYFDAKPYSSSNFVSLSNSKLTAIQVPFIYAAPIASLGGTPSYGIENSTLHIRGTFTPTANIAAGTKLFSTGQTLSAKVTHGSAINSGTTGSETFVGISIQTNGDVYCLGALTSGVTYSIAVTATM